MGKKVFEQEFWVNLGRHVTENALEAAMQIVGLLVVYIVLRLLFNRLLDGVLARILSHETKLGLSEERSARLQTLQGLVKSLAGYVLFFVFGILLFQAIGFNIMPFITTAGVIGLAIGFGAQKLVKDIISGFFIIVDDLFIIGDTVTIGSVTGQVQVMGMRVTRMLDASGKVHVLSNGDIGAVTNLSRNPVEDFIEVAVAASADLNRVVQSINASGVQTFAENDHKLKEAPHVLGITGFTAASTTVRVGVVSDPRHLTQEQMRVREVVRTALLAADIPLA